MSAKPRQRSSRRSRSRTLETSVEQLCEQNAHSAVDLVADQPDFRERPSRRVRQRPIFDWHAEHRALVAATHRHRSRRAAGKRRRQLLGDRAGKIDVELAHRLHNFRMDAGCGLCSGRVGDGATTGVKVEERGRHLAAPGVVNAHEQDARGGTAGHPATLASNRRVGLLSRRTR